MIRQNKKQIQYEKTYNRFLEVIVKKLNEDEIDKITIRSLCSELGLSPRTFYIYFESKESAILECYGIIEKDYYKKYFEAIQFNEEDPLHTLILVFSEYFNLFLDYPKMSRSIAICSLISSNPTKPTLLFSYVKPWVERCQREHIINEKLNLDEISWDLIHFSRGLHINYLQYNESSKEEYKTQSLRKLKRFIRGLKVMDDKDFKIS